MTTTISGVSNAHPEQLTDAGRRAADSAGKVSQQIADGHGTLKRLDDGWQGSAADAANASANRTFSDQQKVADTLRRLQSVLTDGGSRLSGTKNSVTEGVNTLKQQGFQVADDGTVSVRPGSALDVMSKKNPVIAMQLRRLTAANSVKLKTLLAQFDSQDRELADAIRKATDGLHPAEDKPKDPNTPQPPPPEQPKPTSDDTDAPVPGPDAKPGDPGYKVPHAPGDPAEVPPKPGWKVDAKGETNPPGYPPQPPGEARDQNWRDYLNGKNGDGTRRPAGQPPEAYPLPEAVTDKKLKIVGAAENQQGTRYVWGGGSKDGATSGAPAKGTDPYADKMHDYEHTGFDCSGLSEYAIYQATGYDPGKGTSVQYPNMTDGAGAFGSVVQTGPKLDTSQLQPGDVIYYDGGQGVAGAHVAIYMGNGVTVETNESGTPVHSQAATTSNGPVRVVRPN
ncbi:NlpC/P60 family protein [Mycolicibacterium fortuitum]|uniref:NLP/P60 protein n=1 Tax=Mycolicibacterium fortuitum subsp. fortuitum DSM 46621 = ATCC 6841 = JCM 6387 TaxID=1214102 RepID=K0V7J8_MYCFO|nr:NlpC/P60 family protein [Mycolicibacterium fortuitum]AJR29974.1 Invasion associated protein p60 [Mycobacterium sp. VKM Ac-1817D]CRL80352.1 NLP/P60 protein [Mycolicibacter nonchromogenicus]EJZ13540.1 NLP/P60 protein [Mycolicibacterium fortuitum subsp. fortuitum DSM 46621 = ATCC 6841 = JCM 6387]WEV33921.1 NlpC/P60 family protein [Mycolicibacterium fortuitum]CRL55108.1 NLP/P60 protein [Mycolicibacterium fortuitum subsp. fortuitum DSM 46621 = ATCC 6841 = JCM 6387]